jgi:3'-phosphoadenosine 5'-phosphosulfate (PAPS) 3'-phosphatase
MSMTHSSRTRLCRVGWQLDEDGASSTFRRPAGEQGDLGDFWSYMMVAEGSVDVAAEPELALYDMAALVPIVQEAGGTVHVARW